MAKGNSSGTHEDALMELRSKLFRAQSICTLLSTWAHEQLPEDTKYEVINAAETVGELINDAVSRSDRLEELEVIPKA